jgi:Zn-dependent protease with chaperone function
LQTLFEAVMWALTPPFPQALLLSAGTLIMTHVLLKLFKVVEPRTRSLFYSLTLLAPLVVYAIYTPSIWITRPMSPQLFVSPPGTTLARPEEFTFVNYTGILCIVGLAFGAATLAVSYLFGVKIVTRCRGIMEVTEEDEPRLYRLVEKIARRIGVAMPRVGLTESLQPNAFMIGHGRDAMVVFSSGLITALNSCELEAVAAHELAHIKNGDFHLMAVISSLKVVSFFNPASYLSASMLAKEREYLADEVGSRATHRGNALKKALVKIAQASLTQQRAILPDLLSGLFIYSQIGSLRAAFTSHPSIDTRLSRIGGGRAKSGADRYKVAVIALVLLGSLALGFNLIEPTHLMRMFFMLDPGFGMQFGGFNHLPIAPLMRKWETSLLPFPLPRPGSLMIIRFP